MTHDMRPLFGGIPIRVSDQAYEMVPIFPDKKRSKRRDRRVIGKYGRLDRLTPLSYQTPFGFVCHPKIYRQLQERSRANAN